MAKQQQNYTLAFIFRSGKNYIERLAEEAYPEIVAANGKINKKDEASRLCLMRGSDNMVLAEWRQQIISMPFVQTAIIGQPASIQTTGQNLRVDEPKRKRRTKAEMEAEAKGDTPQVLVRETTEPSPALKALIEKSLTPAEDPVERVKRQARARIGIPVVGTGKNISPLIERDTMDFPPAEPWVDEDDHLGIGGTSDIDLL